VGLLLSSAAVAVAALVVVGLLGHDGRGSGTSRDAAAPSDLTGEWSGDGRLTHCAGLDDEECEGTRTIVLTIDCSGKRCVVTPFGRDHGHPPLRFADGRYRAAGPLPPQAAPTCNGVPTSTAQWRLELAVRDGRLTGSYAESTVQSFDCGATGLTWEVGLDRT
jgi:hypothetical protein